MNTASPRTRAEQAERLAGLMTNPEERDRLLHFAAELYEEARREEALAPGPTAR